MRETLEFASLQLPCPSSKDLGVGIVVGLISNQELVFIHAEGVGVAVLEGFAHLFLLIDSPDNVSNHITDIKVSDVASGDSPTGI